MQPQTQPLPTRLASVFYGYILAVQVLLAGTLIYLYGQALPPLDGVFESSLAPRGWSHPVTVGAYLIGVVAFMLAFTLPRIVARRGTVQGPKVLVPYLVQLCLLETTALAGFGLAILSGAALPALPLAALGLIGTLLSPPTPAVISRVRGGGV